VTEESPPKATADAPTATLAASDLYAGLSNPANVLTPQAIDSAFASGAVSADANAEPSLMTVAATPLEADSDQLLLLLASEQASTRRESPPADSDVTLTSQADAPDSFEWLELELHLGDR
jgi:hypothetical protein